MTRNYNHSGFTLIEILVVVVIVVIIATFASTSINTAIRMHRQIQAVNIICNSIRHIRSFALSQNLDEKKEYYFDADSGLATRNAFSIYFFRGRLNPEYSETSTDEFQSQQVVGMGDGNDGWDLSYSILPVKDPGYDIGDRVMSPDHPNMSGSAYNNSISGLSDLAPELYNSLIALPKGVVLLFGDSSDGVDKGGSPSSDLLGDVEHVSYDVDGLLITKVKSYYPSSYHAFTSPGFSSRQTYIAVMMIFSGTDIDENLTPIYIDLRTGAPVKDSENMSNVRWPLFSDT